MRIILTKTGRAYRIGIYKYFMILNFDFNTADLHIPENTTILELYDLGWSRISFMNLYFLNHLNDMKNETRSMEFHPLAVLYIIEGHIKSRDGFSVPSEVSKRVVKRRL